MVTKVIGIISWLPNDETRQVRQEKLEKLLVKCDNLFNLPIIIVAQNWDSTVITTPNCVVFNYDKLGITGARKKLRERFLESNYDYLIMLDDDCELIGSKPYADDYLQQIDFHNGSIGIFKGTLLKLFAIPKELMAQVEYENVEAEKGEGFEDLIFVETCKIKFNNKHFFFARKGLDEKSDSGNDKFSTWWRGQYVKKEMGDQSRQIIKDLKAKL
jgi:hypothetical protein